MSRDARKLLSRKMRLGRGVRGWVVERPGLQLDRETRDALVQDLTVIASKTVKDGPLDYGVFDDASGAMDRTIVTVLYDAKTNAPIAFNAMPVIELDIHDEPIEVIHLGLVMVDPGARSGGLSAVLYGFACAMLLIRNQFRPIWVSSVTQVPAVVGLVSELYSRTFPSPDTEVSCSFRQLQLARAIMAEHRSVFGVGEEAEFDENRFIISNAYTGGSDHLKKTFEDAPKHRNEAFNKMCQDDLDYDRGDDFLQIGRLDMAALRHYTFRTLPENSLSGSTLALVFFGFQYVLLPIRHWFDTKRHWGSIRPWNA
ncbi:MAG: hypothetical protein AAF996_15040 [Pseudomonadota bacterium]